MHSGQGRARWLGSLLRLKGVEPEESRSLFARCLAIAWPATVEGILLSLIGSLDMMMVGVLGSNAIAAVGLTGQPRMLLLVAVQSLCVGTTALVARRKGAGNDVGARSCLQQSMIIITGIGLVITLVGTLLAEPIMRVSGANADTARLSSGYFRIISLGLIPNCWQLCICAAFRAIGKTSITMTTNIIANLVNVTLNYLLIGGRLGFPAWGVKGAAVATLCGTLVASAIALRFVTRRDGYFAYRPLRGLRFDRDTLSGLAKVGSSSMAESVFLRAGFFINQILVAGLGTAAFAAFQIVGQTTSLSFTLGDGIASAGVSMVAQSLGARRKDLARLYVAVTRRMSVVASFVLMVLIFLLRRDIAGLFTNEPEVIESASYAFLVIIFGVMPQNGRVVYSGCLRGAGDVKYVAMCSLVSVTLLRPLLTYVLCYPLDGLFPQLYLAATGAWIAFVIDAYVRNAMLAARVRGGKWMAVRLR